MKKLLLSILIATSLTSAGLGVKYNFDSNETVVKAAQEEKGVTIY